MSIETDSRFSYYCKEKSYCVVCGKESKRWFMGDQDMDWCGGLRCAYILFKDKLCKKNDCKYCKYFCIVAGLDCCLAFYGRKDVFFGEMNKVHYCSRTRAGNIKCKYYKLDLIKWLKLVGDKRVHF